MESVEPSPHVAARPWLLPLLLASGLAAHAGALGAGRLFDDAAWIRDDPAVTAGIGGVRRILAEPRSRPTSEGRPERPLARLAYAAERAVLPRGEDPARTHHLAGLMWHF